MPTQYHDDTPSHNGKSYIEAAPDGSEAAMPLDAKSRGAVAMLTLMETTARQYYARRVEAVGDDTNDAALLAMADVMAVCHEARWKLEKAA